MKDPVVLIGIGEMGGVFARALLRAGHPVFPANRGDDLSAIAAGLPEPALALLAVGEKDLHPSLERMPGPWKNRLGLLQNELLPRDWQAHGIDEPTVISVWFEKKPGQDVRVLVPSPVHGPRADLLVDALARLDIPALCVDSAEEMLFELVRKNLYILTTNIAGLETGGTVKDLWDNHSILMNRVFDDVLKIQEYLTGQRFDRDRLLAAVLEAFDGDPEHRCMGRSAPARLERALQIADEAGIEVAELRRIATLQAG
jgi:ketopantoate reductase